MSEFRNRFLGTWPCSFAYVVCGCCVTRLADWSSCGSDCLAVKTFIFTMWPFPDTGTLLFLNLAQHHVEIHLCCVCWWCTGGCSQYLQPDVVASSLECQAGMADMVHFFHCCLFLCPRHAFLINHSLFSYWVWAQCLS